MPDKAERKVVAKSCNFIRNIMMNQPNFVDFVSGDFVVVKMRKFVPNNIVEADFENPAVCGGVPAHCGFCILERNLPDILLARVFPLDNFDWLRGKTIAIAADQSVAGSAINLEETF